MLPIERPRFADFVAYHLDHAEQTCARSTVVAYSKAYRRILLPGLGADTFVADIRRVDLRRVHNANAHTPAAANVALSVFRSGWILAQDLDWVDPWSNPTQGIRRHPERRAKNPFSPEDSRVLWDGAVDCMAGRCNVVHPEMAALFAFVLGTGCRRNEATTVLREDIDLARGEATFRDHKTVEIAGPKTVCMGPDLTALMACHLSGSMSRWAFTSPRTGRCYREVNRGWRRFCDHFGVSGSIRDARSGLATNALEAGVELRLIQSQLGHASITTTAKYAGVTRRAAQRAQFRIESAVLRRKVASDDA
ncbi:MAG: tyrosine-type recombinase/integrase [Myxococcota bacterium]